MLDEHGVFESLCNVELVDLLHVETREDIHELRGLISKHKQYTDSANAERILDNWDSMLPKFVKVYPKDYRRVIEAKRRSEQQAVGSG